MKKKTCMQLMLRPHAANFFLEPCPSLPSIPTRGRKHAAQFIHDKKRNYGIFLPKPTVFIFVGIVGLGLRRI